MIRNDEIRHYWRENPKATTKEVANHFGITMDKAQGIKRRMQEKPETQAVETPEGYKGVLTKGKMWQLHDGSWRESLQFEVDWKEQWDSFKTEFLNDLTMLGTFHFEPNKKKLEGDICLEISLPDLHFGKGDIQASTQHFINTVFELLAKAEKFGVERILLPVGNDGLNSEGKRKTTTGGTPQDDSVDWQESFRHYWTTLAATIKVLSATYPVDVLVIPGNHDMERMFYIGEVLSSYFKSNDKVRVNNSGEYRKYYEYGANMLMFTHGDKEKTANLPLIMATEQPEMFARTKYREAHLGHFHKEMLNEYCGVKTRFLPSICVTDDWHKMMGYSHLRAAQAYIWNKKYGLEGYFQVNIHEKQNEKQTH